jgi:hypothetical protein
MEDIRRPSKSRTLSMDVTTPLKILGDWSERDMALSPGRIPGDPLWSVQLSWNKVALSGHDCSVICIDTDYTPW